MADLAISRVQLVDNSRVRADGKRVHRILPWQLVTYPDTAPGLEAVDYLGLSDHASTTKEITGILFVDESAFVEANGVGGDVGGLRY